MLKDYEVFGLCAFKYEIVLECSEHDLLEKEYFTIVDHYNTGYDLYNFIPKRSKFIKEDKGPPSHKWIRIDPY
jgi:hypothetical protein